MDGKKAIGFLDANLVGTGNRVRCQPAGAISEPAEGNYWLAYLSLFSLGVGGGGAVCRG